jgi:hypothetical protein
MNLKRPVVVANLFLGFILIASWALNAPVGYAQAGTGAGQISLAQQQAHGDQSRPKPSPDKLHLASLSNGSFESGPGGSWTEHSSQTLGRSLIVNSTTTALPDSVTPHGGNWIAWLGGVNDESGGDGYIAYISQTVDIPASHPVLSFWEWIDSEDFCGWDYGSVLVNDAEVTTFDLCEDNNTGGWVESTLDLSAYAGQTVDLEFLVTTDDSFISNLFVDDVTLEGQSFSHSVYLPMVMNGFCPGYDYFDDFSDPDSGWYPGVSGSVTHEYVDGEYQIRFDDFWVPWFVTPDLAIPSSNYRVEVDLPNDWVDPGGYGLIFGVHWYWNSALGAWRTDQGYRVHINSFDRTYQINKIVAGDNWPILRNWTYNAAIRPNGATNHLRVDRVGTAIRLYINGTAMPALTDASYTGAGRDAGISAESFDSYPVDMRFDNFHVSICPQ